jgi:hypothetical protein
MRQSILQASVRAAMIEIGELWLAEQMTRAWLAR